MKKILAFFSRYPILPIMALGGLLRFTVVPFSFYGTTGEKFRDLIVMYNWFFNHSWPLSGPASSLGSYYFGPIYYYMLAPFFWIFRFRPSGLVFASAFFSWSGIYLFYALLQEWFKDRRVAILGGFILAISLCDIQNAFFISNPTLLPFFGLLFFYGLTLILRKGSDFKNIFFTSTGLAVAVQLHATAALLFPVTLFILMVSGILRLKIRDYFIGAAVFIFWFFPYLCYEFSVRFTNFKNLFALGYHNYSWQIRAGSLEAVLSFWDRVVIFKNEFFNFPQTHTGTYLILEGSFFVMAVLIAIYFIANRRRHRVEEIEPAARTLLILWLGLGNAIFLFYQKDIQSFYFLVLWPAPVVLFTWLMHWLCMNSRRLFCSAMVTYMVCQGVLLFIFYSTVMVSRYNFENFRALLFEVRDDNRGAGSYNILSENIDVNLFYYYKQLFGSSLGLADHRAEYIYLISDYENPSLDSAYLDKNYAKISIGSSRGFKLTKYKLLNK